VDNFAVPPFCFTVFKLFDSVEGQHSRTASTDMSTDALKMLGYAYIYIYSYKVAPLKWALLSESFKCLVYSEVGQFYRCKYGKS
jgi:hypothetical protein